MNQKLGWKEVVGLLLVAAALAWFWLGGGMLKMAEPQMDDIYAKAAGDAVARYEISNRQGDPISKCVQAGLVAAAQLQAKNESEYGRWKTIEMTDCKAAGVPR